MKLLQMIDVAMLWITRAFALAMFAYFALVIHGIYTDEDSQIIAEATHRPLISWAALPFLSGYIVWIGLLLACTWYKRMIVVRTISGLSAGFFLYLLVEIVAIQSPLHSAIALGMHVTIRDFAVPTWLALGTLAMAWLAIAPNQFRLSRPINCVNPVLKSC